jgi:hypothetical protein
MPPYAQIPSSRAAILTPSSTILPFDQDVAQVHTDAIEMFVSDVSTRRSIISLWISIQQQAVVGRLDDPAPKVRHDRNRGLAPLV